MDFWSQQMDTLAWTSSTRKAASASAKASDIIDEFTHRFPFRERFMLGKHFPGVYLTRREAQSVYYLMQKKTMKETAMLMGLSHRTVEFYLNHAKQKFACNRKQALLKKLMLTPLFAMFQVS